VLEAEVLLVNASALGQPGLELAGGFDDVHAGNDSGGGMGSQLAGRAPGSRLRGFTTEGAEARRKQEANNESGVSPRLRGESLDPLPALQPKPTPCSYIFRSR
jgi:hypothetical protein